MNEWVDVERVLVVETVSNHYSKDVLFTKLEKTMQHPEMALFYVVSLFYYVKNTEVIVHAVIGIWNL